MYGVRRCMNLLFVYRSRSWLRRSIFISFYCCSFQAPPGLEATQVTFVLYAFCPNAPRIRLAALLKSVTVGPFLTLALSHACAARSVPRALFRPGIWLGLTDRRYDCVATWLPDHVYGWGGNNRLGFGRDTSGEMSGWEALCQGWGILALFCSVNRCYWLICCDVYPVDVGCLLDLNYKCLTPSQI